MKSWWGHWDIPTDQTCRWHIGPLELWIAGRLSEWRIVHRYMPKAVDRINVIGPTPDLWPPEEPPPLRFATTPADQRIRLQPVPADRPIVVRPQPGLSLPASHTVVFYVSTPAWVEVATGTGASLVALPIAQLSDTWFGASKMEGTLAYASPTAARLQLDALPSRPGRVRTEIRVSNQGSGLMNIERVQIPAPHLPLFASGEDVLWTPSVAVVRRGGEDRADVTVANGPPKVAGVCRQIAPVRIAGQPNIVVRALGALLPGTS